MPANNSDLIRRLIALGKKVVVVTNCPYELGAVAEAGTVVCNYSVTPESLRAAAKVLYGSWYRKANGSSATTRSRNTHARNPRSESWAESLRKAKTK